jgi:alpha-D-ribose 1-methylphosphonate 5-triphosphate synthase subunit PhnG
MSQDEYKKRESYYSFFSNKKKSDKAIEMITAGYTFNDMAIFFGCPKQRLLDFRNKKVSEGVVFPKITSHRPRLNLGKDEDGIAKVRGTGKKYADYLKIYNKSIKEVQSERMAEARKVMEKVREKRKLEKGWKENTNANGTML